MPHNTVYHDIFFSSEQLVDRAISRSKRLLQHLTYSILASKFVPNHLAIYGINTAYGITKACHTVDELPSLKMYGAKQIRRLVAIATTNAPQQLSMNR